MNRPVWTSLLRLKGKRLLRAFTLIELLVVIAIIAILAAILFPVFAQARESARSANCLSNLKQIGTAMTMYAQDYEETFPAERLWWPAGDAGCATNCCNPNGQVIGWKAVTQPYIKNFGVYGCPSNPNRALATEESDKNFKVSYGANGVLNYFLGSDFATGENTGIPMAAMKYPADFVMVMEITTACGNGADWSAWKSGGSCGEQSLNMHRGKNGIMNWAFFDGHAKALKLEKVLERKGPKYRAGTYNMIGVEEDGSAPDGGAWNAAWWLDQDERSNLCDFYL